MARADRLAAVLPYPLAIEIDRQFTAAAPNATRGPLHRLGVTIMQAEELVAQINAGSLNDHKLTLAGWNPEVARVLKQQSGI